MFWKFCEHKFTNGMVCILCNKSKKWLVEAEETWDRRTLLVTLVVALYSGTGAIYAGFKQRVEAASREYFMQEYNVLAQKYADAWKKGDVKVMDALGNKLFKGACWVKVIQFKTGGPVVMLRPKVDENGVETTPFKPTKGVLEGSNIEDEILN